MRMRACRLAATAAALIGAVAAAGCAAKVETHTHPGARLTGQYPNLNIPPKTANDQLSPDQTKADMASLQSAGQASAGQAAQPPGVTDPAELQKLAATHAAETLNAIEKNQGQGAD